MITSVNERITELIERLKLSPNAFASRLGVKTTIIYNIQKGRNKPSFDILTKICDTFDVNADWLVRGKGDLEQIFLKNGNEKYNINGNSEPAEDHTINQENSVDDFPVTAKTATISFKSRLQQIDRLKSTYQKRFQHDLSTSDKDLLKSLQSIESAGVVTKILFTVYGFVIDGRPDPFGELVNDDFYAGAHSANYMLPEIDYREYKQSMVAWLETIRNYEKSIDKLYNAISNFLDEVKPLDKDNLYD